MSLSPSQERLATILAGMDRLDPHASSEPVASVVKAACADAGWTVTDPALEHALTPSQGPSTPAMAPPDNFRAPSVARWRRWGTRAWRLLRPDVVGAVLGVSWIGKTVYGDAFLHLLATTQFSNALLFLAGLKIAWTTVQGTWYSAHEGEVLGQKWTGLWTPVYLVLIACGLLPLVQGPLGQPISLLAKAVLALFS